MSLAAMSQAKTGTMARDLRWLLEGIADAPAVPVSGITTDSRAVSPGDVFLACQGASSHGIDFVSQAVEAGAAAVVWDSTTAAALDSEIGVTMVAVPGLSHRLGQIANRWFNAPSEHMSVSGVTGTNGKTTVAFLIARCMQLLDRPCAYMGTLGAGTGSLSRDIGLTTPGCIDLHRKLSEFLAESAVFAAMEVSSHALHQKRVDGVRFDSVLFTNLSRDHIDYHGDMEAYGETKARFIMDGDVPHRIVMVDTEFGLRLANRCADQRMDNVVAVSTTAEANAASMTHVHMQVVEADEHGSWVDVRSSWGGARMHLPLAGDFNVANGALVLAQLLSWDVPLEAAVDVLSRVLPPPGRMQRVQPPADAKAPVVYIDYAHTPAGLEAVLKTLRNHCKGALWCVFGCGGDRDRGKRAEMGRIVSKLADRAVVTSDNPRTEDPADIIAAVLRHMKAGAVAIEDRAAAIAFAIENASDQDMVLIAGKGHEDYQVIGNTRRPFSDYEVASANLATRIAQGDGQ
ncbi:MAG TPA: UDP-N-acetylmuramoyl-L-alanyl-D-glutamate--2,6-diaminopimelate ligase [Woeseiaceae bacterium]|nr:UDP-N-acetylmuramoyl-L-alanyl-D-glutamate--2,6-diaminopimelate ligase [Woeseiaceae bacterium]